MPVAVIQLARAARARRAARSPSRCISPTDCRRSTSSACPTPKCAKRAIACAQRCPIRSSTSRRAASPSAWRRPTCRSRPAASTCRSRWASWPRPRRFPTLSLGDYEFAGELALTGELRAVRGALAMVRLGAARRRARSCCRPRSAAEAALVPGARVHAGAFAARGVRAPDRARAARAARCVPTRPPRARSAPDLADVRGQARAKRALEIAAAGGHRC